MKTTKPVLRKFTCAYCDEVHTEDQVAAMCPVCGQLFCKACYETNKLDDHLLDHDYD